MNIKVNIFYKNILKIQKNNFNLKKFGDTSRNTTVILIKILIGNAVIWIKKTGLSSVKDDGVTGIMILK